MDATFALRGIPPPPYIFFEFGVWTLCTCPRLANPSGFPLASINISGHLSYLNFVHYLMCGEWRALLLDVSHTPMTSPCVNMSPDTYNVVGENRTGQDTTGYDRTGQHRTTATTPSNDHYLCVCETAVHRRKYLPRPTHTHHTHTLLRPVYFSSVHQVGPQETGQD